MKVDWHVFHNICLQPDAIIGSDGKSAVYKGAVYQCDVPATSIPAEIDDPQILKAIIASLVLEIYNETGDSIDQKTAEEFTRNELDEISREYNISVTLTGYGTAYEFAISPTVG